jgi:hypothetical protein
MPTDRVSAVSIIVSTTNPAATSRIPLGRSQARVSASDAGGFSQMILRFVQETKGRNNR